MVVSCQLKHAPPPAAASRGGGSSAPHLQQLRRACVAAAAACAVLGTAGAGEGAASTVMARAPEATTYAVAHAQATAAAGPARWSDRRQCPPWRANSLENIVPENLPRPSARRRFNSITAAAAEESAPPPASSSAAAAASASPDAVLPFLALRSGMGCFSL